MNASDLDEFADFIGALLPATRIPEATAALRREAYATIPGSVLDAAASDEPANEAALTVTLDHGDDPDSLDADYLEAGAAIAETVIRPVIEDFRSDQIEASLEIRNAIDDATVRGWIAEINMPRAVAAALLPSIMGPEPEAELRCSMGGAIQMALRVFAHRQIAGPILPETFGMVDFAAYREVLGRLADDLAAEPSVRANAPEIAVLRRLAFDMLLARDAPNLGQVH